MYDQELGKQYENKDMVKVGCHDCKGCSSCCEGMGDSVWLDPYDVYSITAHLQQPFEALLNHQVELHVEEGLILPNLRMIPRDSAETCAFLDSSGRCSIHSVRPGFCRLFPLGRNYATGKITYFLLEGACPAPSKTKMKVNKWLGIPNIGAYEEFLLRWHELTKALRAYSSHSPEDAVMKAINMTFLQTFYLTPYEDGEFYPQFARRMEQMNSFLKSMGF